MDGQVTIGSERHPRHHCTTTDDEAYGSGSGGGRLFVHGGDHAIVDNDIYRNDSTLHGGGGFSYGAFGDISLNRVYDNTSAGDGGGFSHGSRGNFTRERALPEPCREGDGGAMRADYWMVIQDNDFHDNDAAGTAAAVQLFFLNAISIVRDNTFGQRRRGPGRRPPLDHDDLQRSAAPRSSETALLAGELSTRAGLRSTWLSQMTFEGNSATECAAHRVRQPTRAVLVEVAPSPAIPLRTEAPFCMTHEWKDDAMTEADRSGAFFLNVLLVDTRRELAIGRVSREFGAVDVHYATIRRHGPWHPVRRGRRPLSITRSIFATVGAIARGRREGAGGHHLQPLLEQRGGWGDIGG